MVCYYHDGQLVDSPVSIPSAPCASPGRPLTLGMPDAHDLCGSPGPACSGAQSRRLALIAERQTVTGAQLIGLGRCEPFGKAGMAEVAFVLEDASHDDQQLGAVLMESMRGAAEARARRRLKGYVLADNHGVLRLLATR